jgi:hypothetical protein
MAYGSEYIANPSVEAVRPDGRCWYRTDRSDGVDTAGFRASLQGCRRNGGGLRVSGAARSLTSWWVRGRRWSRPSRTSTRIDAWHGESRERLPDFVRCCLTTELRSWMCEADSLILRSVRGAGESQPNIHSDSGRDIGCCDVVSDAAFGES